MEQYSVILVWSSSHAIRVEHVLNQAGIKCKLIPTPRQWTSDCGISVRIKREDADEAKRVMDNAWAEYEEIKELGW
jgi:hypothetical protein